MVRRCAGNILSERESDMPELSHRRSGGRGLMQTVASDVVRHTLYPLLKWYEDPKSQALLGEFQQYEFSSPEILARVQSEKLRKLLEHAGNRVPYYRQLFESNGIKPVALRFPQDLSQIPVLSKNILRERKEELLAEPVDRQKLKWNASGGSTGEPVQFYQDEAYWTNSRAVRWMFESWWGIRPGEPTACIWGADRDLPELKWRERLYYGIAQIRICNAFALSDERMGQFARSLSTWQPGFVMGYVSALEMFAHFLLNHPQWRIRPRAVSSSAETLTEQQRAVIEKAFDAPVYNFYGSREVNNLAAECAVQRGLHANMLTRYIEIVDELGAPCPPGVPGRILVTDLSNAAMPFIRYENGDIGSWAEDPCPCGRPFPLLEKVWGRSSDFIVTSSGKAIHGEFFTHLFYTLPEVQTFQVLQNSVQDVRVSIVLRSGVQTFNPQKLRSQILEAMGPGVECTIQAVEKIERAASGKHRFTISLVPAPWSASGVVIGRDQK
jgi:phenylacetate-CoA ligase